MPNELNVTVTLPDELLEFVREQCGDQKPYATPSAFISELLRKHKAVRQAAEMREKILEGYEDALAGRLIEYQGNLREILAERKRHRRRS